MSDIPDLPLRHEALAPRVATPQPPLLIMLHGYGTNEEDLLQLAPYIPDQFQIVSFRAPFMLMPGANAWFEIDVAPGHIRGDVSQARDALHVLNESIDAAIQTYHTNPAATFVMGFSQGGAMAGLVALSRSDICGAAILSGVNPFSLWQHTDSTGGPAELLVVHGSYDEVVPVAHGHDTRDTFIAHGFNVRYHEFPIGHTIDLRVIGTLAQFLIEHTA